MSGLKRKWGEEGLTKAMGADRGEEVVRAHESVRRKHGKGHRWQLTNPVPVNRPESARHLCRSGGIGLLQWKLIAKQPNRLHEFNSITSLNDPGLELEIEDELSVLQVIFEVIIPRASIHALGNVREC